MALAAKQAAPRREKPQILSRPSGTVGHEQPQASGPSPASPCLLYAGILAASRAPGQEGSLSPLRPSAAAAPGCRRCVPSPAACWVPPAPLRRPASAKRTGARQAKRPAVGRGVRQSPQDDQVAHTGAILHPTPPPPTPTCAPRLGRSMAEPSPLLRATAAHTLAGSPRAVKGRRRQPTRALLGGGGATRESPAPAPLSRPPLRPPRLAADWRRSDARGHNHRSRWQQQATWGGVSGLMVAPLPECRVPERRGTGGVWAGRRRT